MCVMLMEAVAIVHVVKCSVKFTCDFFAYLLCSTYL